MLSNLGKQFIKYSTPRRLMDSVTKCCLFYIQVTMRQRWFKIEMLINHLKGTQKLIGDANMKV